MSLRRATATVLVSIGVAAALSSLGCAAADPKGGTGRGGKDNGSGTGGAGSGDPTGTGGSTGGSTTGTGGSLPPPINPGNPDATADIKVTADAACAGSATKGEKKQVDLLLMMDTSGSMDEVDPGQTLSRWDNLAQAIPTFVNDPVNAGMMVGLDFFPEGGLQASCTAADYSMPNVPVDMLPGMNGMHAMSLVTAVQGRMRQGGTPTAPALTGAIQAARMWQMAHPERSISVLLLTDGEPQGCNQRGVTQAAAAAQAGTTGMPPIKTYVLGVGPSTGPLDQIAQSGGTMMAYMVTNGGAAELAKALADIRKSTLSCDYAIPKPEAGTLDPTKVTVSVKVGATGNSVEIPNVGDVGGCNDTIRNPAGEGWFYDIPPPGTPTKITLCPKSCGPLQVTDGSEVGVLLGCEPKRIPPPS
jgi:hypothetical protein